MDNIPIVAPKLFPSITARVHLFLTAELARSSGESVGKPWNFVTLGNRINRPRQLKRATIQHTTLLLLRLAGVT
jgi:hypothetical protein